jgi:hypothetical protein
MMHASYPVKQRNRRVARSLLEALGATGSLLLAGAAASAGIGALVLPLVLAGAIFAGRSWWSLRLASRSSIGARSEQRVRAELELLQDEGWRIRHSLRWPLGGDIDHVATAPRHIGLAFAIETKTRTYRPDDLTRIEAIADWLSQRRLSGCRGDAIPVLCLAGTRAVERRESGVVVVSADRLTPVLRRIAGTTSKPRFLR